MKDFFAAIGRGDGEALLALVAEDIEWIIPGEGWPLAGTRDGHAALVDLLETASKSIETSTEPREFVAQGDRVLVVGFARGKIKATNKTFEDDLDLRHHGSKRQAEEHPGIRRTQDHSSGPRRWTRPGRRSARRMLNRKGDPDVRPIQAIRISPVRRESKRASPSSTFTQVMATGPVSSPTSLDPKDRVYSFVPAEVADFKNDPAGRMRTLAKEPGRENVEAVSADLVAMPQATKPADVLWMHLFYHDLHTALIQKKGATAADFNRAVDERLKPGGSYIIVDDAAAVGAGTSDAESLHRIEPASAARKEVEAAGFVLDAESTILANKDDPHSLKVFDPWMKGETDRFAYRFVKL